MIPRVAAWLMAQSLHPSEREAVLGDLAEECGAMARDVDRGAAQQWYWRQVLLSILPNLLRRITIRRRLSGAARRAVPHRSERGVTMHAVLQDVRYSARMLRRRPAVSLVAVSSLGLGLSLATVVFVLLDGLVLRPLPVPRPDDLALVLELRATGVNHNLPYLDFVDYRAGQRSFTDLAAHSRSDVAVRVGDELRVVAAELVSGSLFPMLQPPMRAGRGLSDDDDRVEAPPAVVVSESLWQRLTGREPQQFTPQSLVINNEAFAIAGVVAEPFRGMAIGRDTQVWIPLAQHALIDPSAGLRRQRRTTSWLSIIGRLRAGVTRDAAAQDLSRVEAAVAATTGRTRPKVLTVVEGRQGDSPLPLTAAQPLRLLLGAALLVLVVACANVANLLLTRATERSREMAVRTALGAGHGRLARLLAIETAMLGGLGGLVAIATGPAIARSVVPFLGDFGRPVTIDIPLDWRLIAVVAAMAVVAIALAGLAPIAGVLRGRSLEALADGGRAISAGPTTSRLRRGLVVVQCALSLALLTVALLLSRTVYNLRTAPTGLDMNHVALVEVDPDVARYDTTRAQAYLARAIAEVAALPGVRAAGFGRIVPLGFGGSRMSVLIRDYQPAADEDMELNYNVVSTDYDKAIGLELLSGRWFDARETGGPLSAVVVNETMARRYWPSGAIGRRLKFDEAGPDVEVIGVVRDVKYRMLREDRSPSFYVPVSQSRASSGVLHVRTSGDPGAMLDTLRRTLQQLDPAVPVVSVRTLQQQAAINVSDERLAMLIGVVLGGAGLLLAAVGLYAALAYAVEQRTREIGVRVALGASAATIARLIVRQSLVLAAVGAVIGTGIAMWLARLIESRLYGVAASDTATLVVSAAILAAVATLASYVPARRAARIDPVDALRAD